MPEFELAFLDKSLSIRATAALHLKLIQHFSTIASHPETFFATHIVKGGADHEMCSTIRESPLDCEIEWSTEDSLDQEATGSNLRPVMTYRKLYTARVLQLRLSQYKHLPVYLELGPRKNKSL